MTGRVTQQIDAAVLQDLIGGADRERADRVMRAMLQMGKLDIAALERAAAG
jgi:predicted 3-demethylubiquinone-9 3-methyltransferase (glyoxalase superfamily)